MRPQVPFLDGARASFTQAVIGVKTWGSRQLCLLVIVVGGGGGSVRDECLMACKRSGLTERHPKPPPRPRLPCQDVLATVLLPVEFAELSLDESFGKPHRTSHVGLGEDCEYKHNSLAG